MTRPKTKILVDGGDPQETRQVKEQKPAEHSKSNQDVLRTKHVRTTRHRAFIQTPARY